MQGRDVQRSNQKRITYEIIYLSIIYTIRGSLGMHVDAREKM